MNSKLKNHQSLRGWCEIIALLTVFILSAILISACGGKPKTEAAKAAPAMIVDSVPSADGVMIHYNVYGKADKALVFVHCWSCDCRYWDNQIDAFKDKYKVVTVDLAGHGKSGTSRQDWTMDAYGADVAAVVNKLGLQDVILVGHSMGGPVCIEAARLIPDRITAMVGVDNMQNLTVVHTPEEVDGWLVGFEGDFVNSAKAFIHSIFTAKSDSALVEWVADDMSSAPQEIALPSIKAVLTYDAPEALKDLNIPILCINSDLVPTDVEANRQLVPSFDVKYMPGYGHFIQMENPAEFNRLLQETINEFWPADESKYE